MGEINHDTAAFAEGCRERVLRICRCSECGTWVHPPKAICPVCWSESIRHTDVAGSGHLVSFSAPRLPPGQTEPVVTAVIALDDAEGVRLLARLVDVPADDVGIGMAVDVDWRQFGDAVWPVFRAAGAQL
ncbi:OB-fold domain-containing protein [Acidiferrimicrobium sp. IK]|uniref:Zn-ribbon domain-containing OB-fold protein n=1 Tax=Acidiferrimicrobium sp. IK TaxID=2871700 RepID=UPI0021CB7491|nr:OB-fold domain-containing protein [Acidiferrimicrobium sp. IK]MCU4186657.1 OB-fold domain-containing protein [Acidiferrimicrobium sp. IK]